MNRSRWFHRFAAAAIAVLVMGLLPSVALAAPGDHFVITGPTLVTVGAPNSYTVTVKDVSNATVTDYTGTVTLDVNGTTNLPMVYTFLGTESGMHTFGGVEMQEDTGARTLSAQDEVIGDGTLDVTVMAVGEATHFLVAAATPTSVGTAETLTVTAANDFGATAAGYTGTVHFTSTDPLGATLPTAFDFLVANEGTHAFSNGVTFKSAGTWTITAADGGSPPVAGTSSDVVVAKGDQTVAFTSSHATDVNTGGTYTPTATATSGLPAAITIDGTSTSVCSISAGLVTFDNPGTCKIDADQAGDSNWKAALQVSQVFTAMHGQTITPDTTAPIGAVVGDTYAPTAHATSTFAVAITIDGSTSAVCSIDGGNVVHLNANGTCKVDFNQAGDPNWWPAPQVQQSFGVGHGASTTVVVSDGLTVTYGTNVTFTATVSGGGDMPTGTVQFKNGSSSLGSPVTLSGGVAHLSTSLLTIATHSITAVYAGDGNYTTSTSAAISQVVNAGGTATAVVTSDGSPVLYGTNVTFTATVTGGGVTPTGTVQFQVDGSNLGAPVSLIAGVAHLSTLNLSVADHSITAVYSGDGNYATATSPVFHEVVSAGGTATAVVTSDGTPVLYGTNVTFTTTIGGAGVTPTGSVEFFDGVVSLGTQTLVSGVAHLSTSFLSVTDHSITAVYSGDGNYATATSPVFHEVVNNGGISTTVVTSGGSPSTYGTSVTFTATVSGGGITPTGTVQFKVDGSNVGSTVSLAAGVATFATSSLAVGDRSVTAVYSSDSNYAASTSGIWHQVVIPGAATHLTVTGPTSRTVGVSGTLTVTAFDQYGNTATSYAGTIHFTSTDGTAVLPANSTLSSGAGTFSVAFQTVGTWSVTATDTVTTSITGSLTGIVVSTPTPATYHALTPARVLDSRDGTGGLSGPFSSHVARTFQVSGFGGVPAGATAVTGNLTVTGQSSGGYLFLGPLAMNDPTSSTLNFPVGDDRANAVTVALGVGGTLSITFVGPGPGNSAHAIFDVTGYFTPDNSGATFHALTPARILDSRGTTGGLPGKFTSHVARTFQVTSRGNVPAGATAVTGNLTVTGQTANGYLYIGPVPKNNPTSSTLNFPFADDRANAVTVALGAGGALSVTYVGPGAAQGAYVIFDVTGYFTQDLTGARYVPLTPSRILDSRGGTGGLPGAFASHQARTFAVSGQGGVVSTAIAVTGNLTVTGQSGNGYFFIGPVAANDPTSSTLNFPAGDDRANAVTVSLGTGGTLSVTDVGSPAYAIFDVTGYFVP